MKTSYVMRSLEWLRKQGVHYSVASWFSGYDRKRHDLLGVFDYVAFFPDWDGKHKYKLVGVQVCGQDFQPHVRKINSSMNARMWCESGNDILLIGWRELKKEGWKARTKSWRGGDLSDFPSTPAISKPSKHLKPPDISSL